MKPTAPPKPKNGFALVVTISMMVLLTIIVVATLTLSTVTLRSVNQDSAQAVARANARLALMLAIGHLQREAGPDQRITGNAEMLNKNRNPQWMGVWKTGLNTDNSKPTWIVSGSDPDPDTLLSDTNSALFGTSPPTDSGRPELRAPFVDVDGTQSGQIKGRYAYWVGDQGVKVRVDVANPDEKGKQLQTRERIGRSQSPSEPGLASFDSKHKSTWVGFDSDYAGAVDRKTLVSMGTVSVVTKEDGGLKREEIPNHYFNDLTTGGFGLPVNVRDGGMKRDLSLILDTSSNQPTTKQFVKDFLGATPSYIPNSKIYTFGVSDSKKFTMSPTVTSSYTKAFVGPNWGTLYNYARMWEMVANNSSPMIGLLPRVQSDLRQNTWLPYREAGNGVEFVTDIQHTNSGLSPVVSMAQVGFSIRSDVSGTGPPPARAPVYNVVILMKPIVGLWNPYNVNITASTYQLEWMVAPYLHIKSDVPTATNTSPSDLPIWLRDYMTVTDGVFPTDSSQGGNYMRLRTPSVDFQPGEFRLFSPQGVTPLKNSNNVNEMTATLDIDGAYSLPIVYVDPNATTKVKLGWQSGTRIWVDMLDLQDTHKAMVEETKKHFPGIGLVNAASTWMTLKAGVTGDPNNVNFLTRYTDLWNGGHEGKDSGKTIPEPAFVNVKVPTSYAVDGLSSPGHLATWRFMTRNSTEVEEANQGLRGWVDANPRTMSNNFRLDGSSNTGSGLQGWNVCPQMMGGLGNPSFGDGGGGNRGLVAQGATMAIPEGISSDTRWQGLTGPASTTAGGGLSNVVVYDVPQAPLTSIGQFQHANLSRYNFEPGFVVGNSYANPRIPLGSTTASNFGNMGFDVVDIAYEANQRLWDTCFFSTLAPDYKGGGSFDQAFDYNGLVLRTKSLPNPRMIFSPVAGDTDFKGIIDKAGSAAPQTMATRIMIEGAFNVNSTSKTAWKAILSTMDGSELPFNLPTSKANIPDWTQPKGIRFSRFNIPILPQGYAGGGRDASFWQGWRELSDKDLDALAAAIVAEVKDRGPFRSMADFVNRNPKGTTSQQQKGALQAAIDKSINSGLPESISLNANNPKGSIYSAAITNEKQAAGHAAYLLQGDILQCLAPIMTVRSDYFCIRTCGEAVDKNGNVLAKAWCEAFVQRVPEYVDSADSPELPLNPPSPTDASANDKLSSKLNQTFGRRFKMVSFRWLNPAEI